MSQPSIFSLIRDGETLKTIELDLETQNEAILGRSPECRIHLDDRAVSRKHAIFKKIGNSIQVEKKSEFSPLVINGVECTSAVLKEGDLISIGSYHLRYGGVARSEEQLPPSPAPPLVLAQDAPVEVAPPIEAGAVSESPEGGLPALGSAESSEGSGDQKETGEEAVPLAFEGQPENSGEGLAEGGVPGQGEGSPGGEGPVDLGEMSMEGVEVATEPTSAVVDENAATKVLVSSSAINVRLSFKPGTANVTEFPLEKEVVTIGRSQECDVVLNDKKASRKNATIRKSGMSYIIQDLQSSNGTFVNGVQITEQELSAEDVIKIGNVEFVFHATHQGYLAQQKNLPSLPEEGEPGGGVEVSAPGVSLVGAVPAAGVSTQGGPFPGLGGVGVGVGVGEGGSVPGIVGIAGVGTGQKKTLLERYKALPKRTQVIFLVAAAAFGWWVLSDEEPTPSPTAKTQAVQKKEKTPEKNGEKKEVTFDMLTADQKHFVEAQHALAFDYYRNREYDKAIFEIEKIFTLVPDYKDSKEIERYAREGKRKIEAIEEERRRKEEEAQLKIRVAQLLEETKHRMEKKQYDQAREYFAQILAIDPDNSIVANWRKEVDDYEEQVRLQKQQKQVEAEINEHGWALYKEGQALIKAQHFHQAMPIFQKAIDIGVSDPTLIPAAKKRIAFCHLSIARKRNPVLARAEKAEKAGEFTNAFALYLRATKIDPPHPAGYAGMNRIRGVLHERAKAIYTEAILAESYSDFETAKKLYQDCLQVAPKEDVYHDRAQRKLARYFQKKDEGPQ